MLQINKIQSVYPHTPEAFKELKKKNSKEFRNLFIKFLELVKDLVIDFNDLNFRLAHCVCLQHTLGDFKKIRKGLLDDWYKKCFEEIVEPIQNIMDSHLAEEMTGRDKKIILNLLKKKFILEFMKK